MDTHADIEPVTDEERARAEADEALLRRLMRERILARACPAGIPGSGLPRPARKGG